MREARVATAFNAEVTWTGQCAAVAIQARGESSSVQELDP